MAVGDVQIALPNGPAPTSKTVIGQTAIRPKAVNATFDGSGAAGPFLPCLVITGREGFEVARVPAPQVAAGASAEVSWFPRVGGASASASITDREQLQSNAATTILTNSSDLLDWNHFTGSSLLNLTNPKQPTVKTAGVYAITTTVVCVSATTGASFYHQLTAGSPDFPEAVQTAGPSTVVNEPFFATCSLTYFLRTNIPLFANVFNFDTVSHGFRILRATVQRIS